MKDFLEVVVAGLGVLALVFILAVVSGTVVWLVWPVVNQVFPALVQQGILASHLSWWDSVCLTWLFGLLIRSTNTNNAKK